MNKETKELIEEFLTECAFIELPPTDERVITFQKNLTERLQVVENSIIIKALDRFRSFLDDCKEHLFFLLDSVDIQEKWLGEQLLGQASDWKISREITRSIRELESLE